MFRGRSTHKLDAKGRLIIPARFRAVVSQSSVEGLMVSMMDGALFCYSFEEWHKIEERILNQATRSEYMRRFRRIFIGGAFECLFDKQGRILIPPTLRENAGLGKEVVLVGVLHHFEIWSAENWLQEDNRHQEDLKNENVRQEISQLGL